MSNKYEPLYDGMTPNKISKFYQRICLKNVWANHLLFFNDNLMTIHKHRNTWLMGKVGYLSDKTCRFIICEHISISSMSQPLKFNENI